MYKTGKEDIEALKYELSLNAKAAEKDKWGIYRKFPYSVSKIISELKAPFDEVAVANKTFNAHYDDESSKYYHKSVEDILNMWKVKREFGTSNGKSLDDFIGKVLGGTLPEDEAQWFDSTYSEAAKNKCRTFKEFYDKSIKGTMEFFGREETLLDDNLKVNGRLDALFLYHDNLMLVDWKNTEKITTENRFENMRGPLYNYQSTDLNGYTMQVYIYLYILRKVHNITGRKIVPLIIQIGEHEYKVYQPMIPYSDELVEKCIKYAIDEIVNRNLK